MVALGQPAQARIVANGPQQLIGAGAVLTMVLVKDARSFIHRNNEPLLASPSQVVETMYWHEIPDEGYQLTLGP
jgi:hypothetical protein